MAEEFSYLNDRVEAQRKWHSTEAGENKRWYYTLEIITLVAGALIPVVNVFDVLPTPWLRVLSSVLATIVVIAAGLNKLYGFQENWLHYRLVSEALKREREFYLHKTGDYEVNSEQQRNRILVGRVEDILTSTTSQFVATHRGKREQSQPPGAPEQ